jgi:hypothetical protein
MGAPAGVLTRGLSLFTKNQYKKTYAADIRRYASSQSPKSGNQPNSSLPNSSIKGYNATMGIKNKLTKKKALEPDNRE